VTSFVFWKLISIDSSQSLYWSLFGASILNIGVNLGIEINRSGTLSVSSLRRLLFSVGALIPAVLFLFLITYFFGMVGMIFTPFFVIALYLSILVVIHQRPGYLIALISASVLAQVITLLIITIEIREITTFPSLFFLISLCVTTVFPSVIRFGAKSD
jgi:hypothetical protein